MIVTDGGDFTNFQWEWASCIRAETQKENSWEIEMRPIDKQLGIAIEWPRGNESETTANAMHALPSPKGIFMSTTKKPDDGRISTRLPTSPTTLREIMRGLLAALLLSILTLFGSFDNADAGGTVSVRGYTTSRGTYVAPHYRTSPNSTRIDNWSTRGNVNPFTGKSGTKSP